jgi:hypothetical protein
MGNLLSLRGPRHVEDFGRTTLKAIGLLVFVSGMTFHTASPHTCRSQYSSGQSAPCVVSRPSRKPSCTKVAWFRLLPRRAGALNLENRVGTITGTSVVSAEERC